MLFLTPFKKRDYKFWEGHLAVYCSVSLGANTIAIGTRESDKHGKIPKEHINETGNKDYYSHLFAIFNDTLIFP